MNYQDLYKWHTEYHEKSITGRYITLDHIKNLYSNYSKNMDVEQIGTSVENRPIHALKLGTGKYRILAWSQMHGNESTTTKALFDFFKWIDDPNNRDASKKILERCSLFIIPMLNPDGAQKYTRLNANQVDLNRDAQDLSQPESKILRDAYNTFKPHFCLNLHGQRTIFGVGDQPKSSIISFLSPAQDDLRMVTHSRKKGMCIIATVSDMLQEFIPESVGRYDDSFNINCVGDTFQQLNTPTILFEAGHYNEDYEREYTRKLIFLAWLKTLETIGMETCMQDQDSNAYFAIPENKKCFYDHLVRALKLPDDTLVDLAVQYEEKLKDDKVIFVPKIANIGNLDNYQGHQEYNARKNKVVQSIDFQWVNDTIIENILLNDEMTITFSLKNGKSL